MAKIPSPISTGNAGANYEHQIGAACLAVLLTGGMMLTSAEKVLTKVHLQARHRGWATDDLLLEGEGQDGIEHRVAIQAKRTFVLQKNDEECVKTLHAAWTDFSNATLFRELRDRIVLITGETPTSFTRGMRSVLDAARASLDVSDFNSRSAAYFSKDARHCFDVLCNILRAHAGVAATNEAIWRFLRIWDFIVLDFHASSGTAQTLVTSLLSATAVGPLGQANDTWNSLLTLVARDSGRARSFDRNALPPELRERHQMPNAAPRETLESLRLATAIVRDGIEDRLANNVMLPRPEVVSSGLASLDEMDALVVTGPAGNGKSVVAAKIYDVLAGESLGIAFRSDSLATPHLATSALNIGLNLRALMRLYALHPRRLLWIESAERLFEKSRPEREAFVDLMRLISRERGWKLIITCREYSAEKFRAAFLEGFGIRGAVLPVPGLSDRELDSVATAMPKLSAPLSDPLLRRVLRNPLNLHLAARMSWPETAGFALSRRSFREKAWREVVCRDDEPADGMPLERERVMIEVALRRARALAAYVHVDGISARALHALEQDSLVVADPADPSKFSPSHDVYEDWALLQFIQRQWEQSNGVAANLFAELGSHPAIRRSFRIWLLELVDVNPTDGEQLVLSMINDTTLSGYWRDEALVAVFQSAGATGTLLRLGSALLTGDGEALRRAVHLLRVSCRKLPPGVTATVRATSFLLVPDGGAWDVMPFLLFKGTSLLRTDDILWILGFLEDWAKGARQHGTPKGAEAAAALCELLLSCVENVNHQHRRAFRERVVSVMLSIPRASEQQLRAMVEKAVEKQHGDTDGQIILKLIWSHFAGSTVCRELPGLTLQVAESKLRLAERTSPHPKRERMIRHRELESVFGLGHFHDLDDFPASAWQGPFLNLLLYHPDRGIELIQCLANKCCAAYAADADEIIEPPFQTEIIFNDGSRNSQWANERLWRLYRGSSVGPDVLKSALMALETWLLQKGERGDADFREIFSRLLRESDNVAVTAVLASVAMAYPHLLAESAVPLFTNPGFFDADLERLTHDQADINSSIEKMWPSTGEEQALCEGERRDSSQKRHRRESLESLAVMLQMTAARPLMWALFDQYIATLPPDGEQNDEDRVWRLRLHRIDVRNFARVGEMEDGRVVYQPGPASPELEEFKKQSLPAHHDREHRTWLYLWGVHVFEWREPEKYRPEDWREKLLAVRALPPNTERNMPHFFQTSGAPQIAAVCLRDRWTELEPQDRAWCIERVCQELESLPDLGVFAVGMTSQSDGVNAAAQVAPLIIARTDDPQIRTRATSCLSSALLHPERHIVQAAANGIGAAFFELDSPLVLAGVHALLEWVRETLAFEAAQRLLPWGERRSSDDFDRELRGRLRDEWGKTSFDEAMFFTTDFFRGPSLMVLPPLLGIFGRAHSDPFAHRIHAHLAEILLQAWRSDKARSPHDDALPEVELRYVERQQLTEALARFALACPESVSRTIVEPLAAAALENQEEAAKFVKQLTYCEDQRPSGGRFWTLWQIFADVLPSPTGNDDDASHFRKLVDALLLGISWKPETFEWMPLTGNTSRLLDFFVRLPPSLSTLTSFSILAERFRGELIPRALPALAEKLAALSDRNFMSRAAMGALESILQTLICTGATEIRSQPALRTATLALLEMLVEAGSSAGFALRDDFLTPLPT